MSSSLGHDYPFIASPKVVYYDLRLSISARWLFDTLHDLATINGSSYACPGQQQLADLLGCSVRSVCRYLKELEAFGYLTVE
jgi:hypothetical protein